MAGRFGGVHDVDFDDHDTVLVIDAVEATRHFMPNRRGASVVIALLLAVLVVVLGAALGLALAAAIRNPNDLQPAGLLLVSALTVLLAWGCSVFARRALGRKAVLSLTEDGIESPQLRAPVAWHDLVDAELNSGTLLLLTRVVDPSPGWWRRLGRTNGLVRRIGLDTLKPLDQKTLFGEIHARLAEYRRAEGLGEAPSLAQARADQALHDELDVHTPVPWALYGIVGLNALVWVLTVMSGLSATRPLPAQLFQWGANSAWAVVRDHEYWRLLTATVLHAGFLHLALNLFALWQAGREVCRWHGNAGFALIYLAAALVGSGLSLHYSAQQVVSVGASGAVFGVLGAFVVTIWRHGGRFPSVRATSLMWSQGLFLLYMLWQGFGKQGIDNAAHVGGLVAGALLAALLPQMVDEVSPRGRLNRFGAGAAVALAMVVALVATTPAPSFNPRQTFRVTAELARLNPRLQAAEQALQRDMVAHRDGKLPAAQFMAQLEQRHIPAYQLNNRLLEPLTLPAATQDGFWLADFKRHNQLMADIMVLQLRKSRGDPDVAEIDQQAAAAKAELEAITRRLKASAGQRRADGASAPF